MRVRATTVFVATMALAGGAAIGASASKQGGDGHGQRPRVIHLQTPDQSVRATPGSYCLQQDAPDGATGSGICADAAYPLPTKGRLDLEPGQRFALRTHDPEVKRIRLSLLRVKGQGAADLGRSFRAVQRPGHPSRWIARLPENASVKANTIDIGVAYEHGIGSADNWAGLRVERR